MRRCDDARPIFIPLVAVAAQISSKRRGGEGRGSEFPEVTDSRNGSDDVQLIKARSTERPRGVITIRILMAGRRKIPAWPIVCGLVGRTRVRTSTSPVIECHAMPPDEPSLISPSTSSSSSSSITISISTFTSTACTLFAFLFLRGTRRHARVRLTIRSRTRRHATGSTRRPIFQFSLIVRSERTTRVDETQSH